MNGILKAGPAIEPFRLMYMTMREVSWALNISELHWQSYIDHKLLGEVALSARTASSTSQGRGMQRCHRNRSCDRTL